MAKRTGDEELGTDENELIHTRDYVETHEEEYEVNFVGAPQPTYGLNFVGGKVSMLKDDLVVQALSKDLLKPEFKTLSYPLVSQMISFFKKQGESAFVSKYFVENAEGKN